MSRVPLVVATMLLLTGMANAKVVEREVAPGTGWGVTVGRPGPKVTSFRLYIPFKNKKLPPHTTASLSIYRGRQLVVSAQLRVEVEQGRTFFRFTVADDLLIGSKFSLMKLHPPFPSGDRYWADLAKYAKFARTKKKKKK